MLHRHDFTATTRRPPFPRLPDAVPLSASGYVRLRRLAAGLSEHDLAQRLAALYVHTNTRRPGLRMLDVAKDMLTIVRAIELPGAVAKRDATIEAVAAVIPLDTDVYRQLARDPAERHPRVCRGCGASTHDHDAPTWATRTSCIRCDATGTGL